MAALKLRSPEEKTSELNLTISTSLLTVNMKNAEKDSPGEKINLFTSGAVSKQISRLEQLSQEKGDGWTNEGGAEIFANEGARCRPFSTLTNKALFERRAEAQIFKEKKGNTHKDCYQENCSQGKKRRLKSKS